jgi:hypothetical protein
LLGGPLQELAQPDHSQDLRNAEEAEIFQANQRLNPNHADHDRRGKTPFAVVAEEWLTHVVNNGGRGNDGVRPKTLAGYKDVLNRFLLPHLEDIPIGRINARVLNEFKAALPKHLSPTSRRAILSSCLRSLA